eukprot:635918-Amphidinium_carterae.1
MKSVTVNLLPRRLSSAMMKVEHTTRSSLELIYVNALMSCMCSVGVTCGIRRLCLALPHRRLILAARHGLHSLEASQDTKQAFALGARKRRLQVLWEQ